MSFYLKKNMSQKHVCPCKVLENQCHKQLIHPARMTCISWTSNVTPFAAQEDDRAISYHFDPVVGNSLEKASLGGSETEAWTGNNGDSLGRGPLTELGGSETEAWISWTDRKPWEIAWGELRFDGARRKRGHCGQTGDRRK